jgi:AcrR family transcriptional regulator
MREWIPMSTSPKGRLVLEAVKEFGRTPFDEVTVSGLAAAAGATTGVLYHHFGSKLGLYAFVRDDVERRLLDRMEGALGAAGAVDAGASRAADGRAGRPAAGGPPGVRAALLVGFDYAVREGYPYLLGAPPVGEAPDRLRELVATVTTPVMGSILAAAWRAAVLAAAATPAATPPAGAGAGPDPVTEARAALEAVLSGR